MWTARIACRGHFGRPGALRRLRFNVEVRATTMPLLCAVVAAASSCDRGTHLGPTPPVGGLVWCDVLESEPDPLIVTRNTLRERIREARLPWRVRDKASGIELLLVPGGDDNRGNSSTSESGPGRSGIPSTPLFHSRRPFYLGRHEVTYREWIRVLGTRDSKEDNRLPTTRVSFNEILDWCTRARGLRLPTEEEWEYACREAGEAIDERYGELDAIAWCATNARFPGHPVGTKLPNALGLSDMIGNVWEFVRDGYRARTGSERSANNALARPSGVTNEDYRMVCGGSWADPPDRCIAASRSGQRPDSTSPIVGFRVARDP